MIAQRPSIEAKDSANESPLPPPPPHGSVQRKEVLSKRTDALQKRDGPPSNLKFQRWGYTGGPQVYKVKEALVHGSISSLLEYIDFLKPLLLSGSELIPYAVRQFNQLQARVRPPDVPLCLESFEISIGNARKFFPSVEPSLERVLQLLSYHKPVLGQYIFLLDVLTVLVIIFRAPLEEKARWLFDWYNLSNTGIMTETEHVLLVQRISDCLFRIKAIGLADVTEEDAAQIALEARVRKTASGQLRYLPGLTFDDFLVWARESPESVVLVKFVRVLDRLVDTLVALRDRVDAVNGIIGDKRTHHQFDVHVPRLDSFPFLRQLNTPLLLVYRSHDVVSLCLPSAGIDLASCPEVYIRCEQLRPVPEPLYGIPDTLMGRKRAKGQRPILSGMSMCCSREYTLVSHRQVRLHRQPEGTCQLPLFRVDVQRLDPSSRFVFTVYTPGCRFPSIGVSTSTAPEQERRAVSVGLLPASLSLEDCESFVKATPVLDCANGLVFTGTLCPVDKLLRQSLLFADQGVRSLDADALGRVMQTSCEAIYGQTWTENLSRLVGLSSAAAAPASANMGHLYPAHAEKLSLYHNALGPWGSTEVLEQLRDLWGPLFPSVCARLETVYSHFCSVTAPSRPLWSLGRCSLVFLRCPNYANSSLQLANMALRDLTEMLLLQGFDLGDEGADEGEGEGRAATQENHKLQDLLTVVLRSPLDLLLPTSDWETDEAEATDDVEIAPFKAPASVPVEVAMAAPAPAPRPAPPLEEPPRPRLTGRHELLHGEYSSRRSLTSEEVANIIAPDFNTGVVVVEPAEPKVVPSKPKGVEKSKANPASKATFDSGFEAFVKALCVWISGDAYPAAERRQARLVSCGWQRGLNFEIVQIASGARIEHINLLPTRTEADAGTEAESELTDVMLARMRVSLPEGFALTVLGASPLRAMVLEVPPTSASGPSLGPVVTFLPVNKIVDKALVPVEMECSALPPVRVLDGPRLARLSATEAHVVAAVLGHGRVRCTLYELPFEIDQPAAVGLVAAEREKLRVVASQWRRCSRRRHVLFSFLGLLPYCNYCAAIDPDADGLPLVVQFRTLYAQSSTMSSVVLAAVSEVQYSHPSASAGKIAHLFEGIRPPAAPIHLVHHFSRRQRTTLGLDKPHKADLQFLYQRASVVHTLAKPSFPSPPDTSLWLRRARQESDAHLDLFPTHTAHDPGLVPVHVAYSGKFCRMAPRDGSQKCLRALIEAVGKMEVLQPLAENLLLVVQRPLIRFLQKQPSGKWSNEGLDRAHMDLCCAVLDSVLLWKARVPGRDCQIVCFAEVASMQVATIGFRQPQAQYDHQASLGSLDHFASESVPPDIVSSSVAYEDKADDDSSLASGLTRFQLLQPSADDHEDIVGAAAEAEEEAEAEAAAEAEAGRTTAPAEPTPLSAPADALSLAAKDLADEGFALNRSSSGSGEQQQQQQQQGSFELLRASSQDGTRELPPVREGEEGFALEAAGSSSQSLEGSSEDVKRGSSWFNRKQRSTEPSNQVDESGFPLVSVGSNTGSAHASESDEEGGGGGRGGKKKGSGWLSRMAGGQGSEGQTEQTGEGGEGGESPKEKESKTGSSWFKPSSFLGAGGGGGGGGSGSWFSKPLLGMFTGLGAKKEEEKVEEKMEKGEEMLLSGRKSEGSSTVKTMRFGPEVNLRHIILPIWEGGSLPPEARNLVVFPSGLNMLGSRLEYFLNRDTDNLLNVNISSLPQRRNFYGEAVTGAEEPETAVFLLDLFIRPGEGNTINSRQDAFAEQPVKDALGNEVNDDESIKGKRPKKKSAAETLEEDDHDDGGAVARVRSSSQYHHFMSRSFVHNVDFFELVMGPVVGNVTTDSARILLEVNQDVVELKIEARPLRRLGAPPPSSTVIVGDDEEPASDSCATATNVKAFKVFSVRFEGLVASRHYCIFIPDLYGDKVLGSFRTPRAFSRHAEVIFAGKDPLRNNPSMDTLLDMFYSQQMVEVKFFMRELVTLRPAKISSLFNGYSFPSLQVGNLWTLVGERLQLPMTEAHMVIHLGSQSFLTTFLAQVFNVLLENGRRLYLPIRDASAVEGFYFNQFEEVVRDTFRLLWAVPVIREALASGSHTPLFHPDYLLSTRSIPETTLANPGDQRLVAVIRKVYETHFHAYISALYDWLPESAHHARTWRSGPLVVIMLDLVSGRRKLKKPKKDGSAEGGETPSKAEAKAEAKKGPVKFSVGFLDREQWALIKNVAEDEFVTQIVIASPQPFLSLYDIPFEPIAPTSLPKGECLEWCPTVEDLDQFLMFWVDWLQPKPKRAVVSRTIALVSGSFIPYTTVVQDLMTGSKIQQMCVGAFNADPAHVQQQQQDPPRIDDFQLKGKIGRLRYAHKFGELDSVSVDSSREGRAAGRTEPLDGGLGGLMQPGYGLLRCVFDSWKNSGQWSIVTESFTAKQPPSQHACLIVGPILGPPQVTEASPDDNLGSTGGEFLFHVSVLIEVDRATTVTFLLENSLTGEEQTFSFDCIALRPVICSLGPLEVSSRYKCRIVRGVRPSHCHPFVISTHVNWSESNFAFINCAMTPHTLPCEDMPKELLLRLKVPFSGITCVVHLNPHPDLTGDIEELRRLPFLIQALQQCRSVGHMTRDVFDYFEILMERVRDLYRRHLSRPAYRELLSSAFTLFMQTHGVFKYRVRLDEDGEEELEENVIECESEAVLRFLHLLFNRVQQEYFEQLTRPQANVLRARFKATMDKEGNDATEQVHEMTPEEVEAFIAAEQRRNRMVEEMSVDAFSAAASIRMEAANPEAHPVKVVFKQWMRDMRPMPVQWVPWISPNRRACIELMPAVEPKNFLQIFENFEEAGENEEPPIDVGVRIVVIDGKEDGSGIDLCFPAPVPEGATEEALRLLDDGSAGRNIFFQALKFTGGKPAKSSKEPPTPNRVDRDLCFVCPTTKFGTVRRPLPLAEDDEELSDEIRALSTRPFASIVAVDSIYRCNASERAMKMMEVEQSIAREAKEREKAQGGKAATKKIQAQRAEEERQRIAEGQRKMAQVLSSLVPDGYAFVEARTSLMIASGGNSNIITNARTRLVGSFRLDVTAVDGIEAALLPSAEGVQRADEDDVPTLSDYVQLPDWMEKFFPSHDGVFAQDEVLLFMRQEPDTKDILKQLEDDVVVARGIELYERSRLSELSRPPDLREVDMAAPGVVGIFLRDLVDRYWAEVVPEDVKPALVPLNDDFMRSFLLSRAMPDPPTQLASADLFAKAMQQALVLSVSLKFSMDLVLHDPLRYDAIMARLGEAEEAALALAADDQARKDAHDRAKFEAERKREDLIEAMERKHEAAKEKKEKINILKDEQDLKEALEAAEYDEARVNAEFDAEKARREGKKDDDSDLDELEEEVRRVEEEERLADEEEERQDRLEEQREREEEEAEAAREALGLVEEEEEEVDEDEEIPDEGEFDEEMRQKAEEERAAKEKAAEEEKRKKPEVKLKTKAQKLAEKKAADELLGFESLKAATEAILDFAIEDLVDVLWEDDKRKADIDELMQQRPRQTDEEALAECVVQMGRLAKEKVGVRRGIGKRLVYLNM